MKVDKLAALAATREALATHLQERLDTPEVDRPTKPATLRAWVREIESTQRSIGRVDQLLDRLQPAGPPTDAAVVDEEGTVVVARIPKGRRAEMRVSVKRWEGRQVIDIRLWSLRDGQSEFVPSRKGIAFDAGKLDQLIEALQLAQLGADRAQQPVGDN